MKHRCDACDADEPIEIEVLWRFTDTPISVCGRCGFVYVVERRSSRAVADALNDCVRPKVKPAHWMKARVGLTVTVPRFSLSMWIAA